MNHPVSETLDVIIPVLNEERSIAKVLGDLPADMVRHTVVVDNGSTDGTARIAAEAGAVVITEPERGYGAACLAGIAHLRALSSPPDLIAFLDGDYSDRPEELERLVEALLRREADLVIGSRALGEREPGALLPQARFGNALAALLIRLLYGVRITDLGPFRVIRRQALESLGMQDRNFGWTVEMQVKAIRKRLKMVEEPVSYRKRIGTSKITGTIGGSFRAGWKILATIFRYSRS
jgi:glycosyltransferase involved in cell wall biosynthesis